MQGDRSLGTLGCLGKTVMQDMSNVLHRQGPLDLLHNKLWPQLQLDEIEPYWYRYM
jgi:hypothetical protein